jgi:methionine-rich copper-binding protein CopC
MKGLQPCFRRAAACVAAAFIVICAPAALAHGFMERTVPQAGSTVRGSPAEVQLWFTQGLEPAFTTVRVLDASGKQVDREDKRVDPGDKTLLRVSLPALAPGKYRVVWRALSADGHVTRGEFAFQVAQ